MPGILAKFSGRRLEWHKGSSTGLYRFVVVCRRRIYINDQYMYVPHLVAPNDAWTRDAIQLLPETEKGKEIEYWQRDYHIL